MEGRTHLFCTFMFLGAAVFLAFKAGYLSVADSVLFVIAPLISVQFPDVDAPNGKNEVNNPLRIPVLITKYFIFLPISILLVISGKKGAEHRGIMHSLKGIFLVMVFWLTLGLVALNYFKAFNYFNQLLLGILGLLSGYLMHLWQDSLTVAGVQLTKSLKIKGWLKTGKHEWVLQMFFLIISAVIANFANNGNFVFSFLSLVFAIPLSFLLFVR